MSTHHLDDFDNTVEGYGQDGQDDGHGDSHGHFRDKFTWTTLITQQRDMGKVANMKSRETKVMKWAHRPGPSSQLADFIQKYVEINKTQASVALSFKLGTTTNLHFCLKFAIMLVSDRVERVTFLRNDQDD